MKKYSSYLVKCFNLLFLLFISNSVLISQRDAIPTASASFGKFIDVPVSHYTGVPNISVPLHTISEGPISVPIGLQYHSSGIKVGELASNVGLGWQLVGGGMVSRTVQGIPDEMDESDHKGYYLHGVDVDYDDRNLIAELEVDGEPDIFHFYAPGLSGQFVFNGDWVVPLLYPTITTIPQSDLRIVPMYDSGTDSFKGFEITTPDGTKYIFGHDGSRTIIETRINESLNNSHPLHTYTSGWHLLEIQSHDNKNSIKYNYNITPIYNYSSLAPAELKIERPKSSGTTDIETIHGSILKISGTEIRVNLTTVIGSRLVSIESRTSTIEFDYFEREDLYYEESSSLDSRLTGLENITINEGTGYCFEYQLQQSYFTESGSVSTLGPWRNRLKLDGLQKISCNGAVEEPAYVFDYFSTTLPHRLSKSIDHWGYHNGQTSNNNIDNLIPPTTLTLLDGAGLVFGSANRDISELNTQKGILTKITYPTGGTTEFTYEGNRAGDVNEPGSLGTLFDVAVGNQSLSVCQNFTAPDKTIFLDAHKIEHGRLFLGVQYTQIGCLLVNSDFETYVEVSVYKGGVFVDRVTWNNQGPGITGEMPLKDLNLTPDASYTFRLKVTGGRGYMKADYILESSFTTQVGGLRIKQIKTIDGLTSSPDMIRNFYYRTDFDDNLSSGIYVGKPIYGFEFKTTADNYHGWAESYSQIPLTSFEGYHVGYSRVEEELNGHGTNVHEFFVESFSHPNVFPTVPILARIISGNGQSTKSVDASGSIITESITNTYEPDEYYNIKGYVMRARLLSGEGSASFNEQYVIRSRKPFRPKSVTNTSDGVTTTTDYEYGDNDPIRNWTHLQPFQITTDVGNGYQKRTKIWYTDNYNHQTTNVLPELRNRNIRTLPLYKQHYIVIDGVEKITGGEKVFFGFFNSSGNLTSTSTGNHPYPYKTNIYEVTTPGSGTWRTVSYNDKYDMRYGFLSQQHQDQWEDQPSTFTYDSYGNLIENKSIKNDEIPMPTSVGLSASYTYYPASSLLQSKTQNDAQSTTYTYDQLLRPKTITDNCSGTVSTNDYYFTNGTSLNYTRTKMDYVKIASSGLDILYNYAYLDGLGRTVQTVARDQGPGTDDDIISHRTYNQWGQVARQYEPFKKAANNGAYVSNVTAAYSTKDYYTEPVGRLWRTKAAGWSYYTTFEYGHNIAADGTITIPGGSTFGTAELVKTKVTDGNGNLSYTFTDKRGRTILKRRSDAADANDIDTYYHYDDKDRLSKSYPPGSSTSTPELIYTYTYNKRDQTLEKKVPSMAKMEYRYSTRGQLRYSRDGYLNTQNKWYAYQYDDYGREVKSGFYNYSGTPGDLSTSAATISEALTENIYGIDNTRDEDRLKTIKTKIMGTSTWLESTSVYDDCGRVTSSTGNNHLYPSSNTAEIMSFGYDWADNKLSDTRTHRDAAFPAPKRTILNTYTYDHAGRLDKSKFKLNSESERILSDLTYDHKNQIISNKVGSKNSGASYLQTMNYTYLENGLLQYTNQSFASSDLFYERLYYDTGESHVTETIQKNGNIAAVESEIRGATAQKRVFGFKYDHLNRMTWADYYDTRGFYDDYKVDNIVYDNRGNLKYLRRRARVSNVEHIIDNLTYAYNANTNQLQHVVDAATTHKTRGYNRKNTSNYTYDTNGNVKYDPSRGVTFTYNHLDLPVTADFGSGKTIEWLYDAGGGLLTKTVKQGGVVIDKRDYVGGIEYKDDVIDVVYHGEGRVVNTNSGATSTLNLSGTTSATLDYDAETINSTQIIQSPGNIDYQASASIMLNPGFEVKTGALFDGHIAGGVSWEYQYTISDHLGNTRVVYADKDGNGSITPSTEIVTSYDYYPFGLKMDEDLDDTRDGEAYQYNGIEYVEDHGLNYNMATYRCLDPALGRWLSIDPAAEKLMSLSPYNSMNNNPISYTDPEGDLFSLGIEWSGGFKIHIGIGPLQIDYNEQQGWRAYPGLEIGAHTFNGSTTISANGSTIASYGAPSTPGDIGNNGQERGGGEAIRPINLFDSDDCWSCAFAYDEDYYYPIVGSSLPDKFRSRWRVGSQSLSDGAFFNLAYQNRGLGNRLLRGEFGNAAGADFFRFSNSQSTRQAGVILAGIFSSLPLPMIASAGIGVRGISHFGQIRRGIQIAKNTSRSRHSIKLLKGKRIDLKGRHPSSRGHYNKVSKQQLTFPHVHDPSVPGGVRAPIAKDYIEIFKN